MVRNLVDVLRSIFHLTRRSFCQFSWQIPSCISLQIHQTYNGTHMSEFWAYLYSFHSQWLTKFWRFLPAFGGLKMPEKCRFSTKKNAIFVQRDAFFEARRCLLKNFRTLLKNFRSVLVSFWSVLIALRTPLLLFFGLLFFYFVLF